MNQVREIAWSRVKTLKLAKALIDRSILVSRSDLPRLRKAFSAAEHTDIIRYFATSLAEHNLSLINYEKNLESAVLWLNHLCNDDLVQEFVKHLCQKNPEGAVRNLIFVTLSPNNAMIEECQRLNAFVVAIICRVGSHLHKHNTHKQLFERVSTHLLSIANTDNMSVRLLLFSYFAATSTNKQNSRYFAKIVRRFGSTVLEHVFSLLLTRKSEAFALEYLRLNIPAVLRCGDYFMHQSMQSVLANYMYRFPRRFTLFLRVFSQELTTTQAQDNQVLHAWLVHIANLYPLASEINNRALAADFWDMLTRFQRDEYYNLVIHRLHDTAKLSNYYRTNLAAIINAKLVKRNGKVLPLGVKIKRRRGRQPALTKLRKPLSPLQLTLWIGEQDAHKQKLRKAS